MNSHLVIFSNHPPPEGILHKCIKHLKVRTAGHAKRLHLQRKFEYT